MHDTQSFNAPNLNLKHFANALMDWYRGQNFNVQQIDMQEGGILVQAGRGGWRNAVGMASALNVTLRQNGANLVVEIGAGKWLDKAAVGAISVFILWPLAVAAAYGAWQQSQLPKQTFEFIRQYVSSNTSTNVEIPGTVTSSPSSVSIPATSDSMPLTEPPTQSNIDNSPPTALRFCPSCGKSLSGGDRFCSGCGHALL